MKEQVAVFTFTSALFGFAGGWVAKGEYVFALTAVGMGAVALWIAVESTYWQGREDALRDEARKTER